MAMPQERKLTMDEHQINVNLNGINGLTADEVGAVINKSTKYLVQFKKCRKIRRNNVSCPGSAVYRNFQIKRNENLPGKQEVVSLQHVKYLLI